MYVLVDLEEKVAIDPTTGIAGEMDEHRIAANLSLMIDRMDKLDTIADDLLKSLDPRTAPMISYPNREGIYMNLGRVTNFAYGMIAGFLVAALIALGLMGVV
jgi:tetrahydromethanopterin S-methyltransferase subunit B